MTHLSIRAAALSAATCLTIALSSAGDVHAQCATCPTPTVAYAPVAVAPAPVVVAPRMGLFDRWRMRRWGVAMPVVAAPTVVAAPMAAAPYTVGYAPTAFAAPAVQVSGYAPLQRQVVQTSFMPVTTVPACSTCPQTSFSPVVTTAYMPTSLHAPAVITPVVQAPACTTCAMPVAPCTTCAAEVPCSSCSTCATATPMAQQAAFVTPSVAPSSGCAPCDAAAGGQQYYGTPAGGYTGEGAAPGDPMTPIPAMEGAPATSEYPGMEYPGPAVETGADGGLVAPPLMSPPFNDQTAGRPTVEVRTAVYRRPVDATSVSTATARPAARAVDAGGWSTVSE